MIGIAYLFAHCGTPSGVPPCSKMQGFSPVAHTLWRPTSRCPSCHGWQGKKREMKLSTLDGCCVCVCECVFGVGQFFCYHHLILDSWTWWEKHEKTFPPLQHWCFVDATYDPSHRLTVRKKMRSLRWDTQCFSWSRVRSTLIQLPVLQSTSLRVYVCKHVARCCFRHGMVLQLPHVVIVH